MRLVYMYAVCVSMHIHPRRNISLATEQSQILTTTTS
jgi:hypothetical protein